MICHVAYRRAEVGRGAGGDRLLLCVPVPEPVRTGIGAYGSNCWKSGVIGQRSDCLLQRRSIHDQAIGWFGPRTGLREAQATFAAELPCSHQLGRRVMLNFIPTGAI